MYKSGKMMVAKNNIEQKILNSALTLAEDSSWEEVQLRDIAKNLEISLFEIHQYYSQKDDLVEAWFDRADHAMLKLSLIELSEMKLSDRIQKIMFTWLDTLATHKTITRDMLWYKFEPLHVHLQVLGLLRISRTVQWIRELAGLNDRFLLRIINEIGLTSIYICTFLYWLQDTSDNQNKTHQFLESKLNCIDNFCCKLDTGKFKAQKPTQPVS